MSDPPLVKMPHPVKDQRTADANRRATCEVRGHCGPFINTEFYNRFPDPLWQGTGECVLCCNTCNVAVEQEKERAAARPAAEEPGPPAPGTLRFQGLIPPAPTMLPAS